MATWLEIHMDTMLWLRGHIILAMLSAFLACNIAQCQRYQNGYGDSHTNRHHDKFIVDAAVRFAYGNWTGKKNER